LKEQRQADLRPNTAKELFNLCYALLRNVIKQIFGVVKRRFKILSTVAEFSINTQIYLVLSLLALYNFIHLYKGVQDKDQVVKDIINNSNTKPLDKGIVTKIDAKRDRIAKDM